MKLEEVLPVLREGRKIRRRVFTKGRYITLKGKELFSSYGYSARLDEDDVLAEDWEMVSEPKKLQSWLKLYDNGEVFGYKSLEECEKSICWAEEHGDAKLVETRLIEWEVGE